MWVIRITLARIKTKSINQLFQRSIEIDFIHFDLSILQEYSLKKSGSPTNVDNDDWHVHTYPTQLQAVAHAVQSV